MVSTSDVPCTSAQCLAWNATIESTAREVALCVESLTHMSDEKKTSMTIPDQTTGERPNRCCASCLNTCL